MMLNNSPNETSINRQLSNGIETGSQILMSTQSRFNSIFNTLVNSQQDNASTSSPVDMSLRNDTTLRLVRNSNQSDDILSNNEGFDVHGVDLVDENESRDMNDNQDTVLNLTSNEPNQDGNQQTTQQQPQSLLKLILMSLQTNIPIILILIAKVFHRHLFGTFRSPRLNIQFSILNVFLKHLGFLIILAFLGTLHWCNRCLVKQIELKVNPWLYSLISSHF